jgi:hypothetical protein
MDVHSHRSIIDSLGRILSKKMALSSLDDGLSHHRLQSAAEMQHVQGAACIA